MTTLGDLARQMDRAVFVGREQQLSWFERWLDGAHPHVAVVNVVGHGGVGKTAMVHRFLDVVHDRGLPSRHVDGRSVDPGPMGFVRALGCEDIDSAVAAIDELGGVLLCDRVGVAPRAFAPLWDAILPRLSVPVRVVVASRREVPVCHGGHPLRRACHRMDLTSFNRAEVRDYLVARGLDEGLTAQVWEVTRGNPLATSIAVDVLERGTAPQLEATSEWRRALPGLTERLLADLDGPQRELVEAAAVVRQFDGDLLSALVDRDVPAAEVEMMARFGMVRVADRGLGLHDDVRDLVREDLRRRRPEHVTRLRSRALRHYQRRMAAAASRAEREWLVHERLYLWEHDVVRTTLFPAEGADDTLVVERARPEDAPAIEALWRRYGAAVNPVQGGAPVDDVSLDEVATLLGDGSGSFMVVRAADETVLACGLEVPIAEDTVAVTPQVARPGVQALRTAGYRLPASADGSPIRYLGPIVAAPDDIASQSRLARWAIGSWAHGGVILVATRMPGYAALMGALGFVPVGGVEAAADDPSVRLSMLDLDDSDVEDWIRRVTALAQPTPATVTPRPTVEIQLLGGFAVRRDGRDATPSGQAAQALKHVVVAGGSLHVEELVGRLWPDTSAATGRTRLRNVLSRLRDSSGDVLVREGDTLRLGEGVAVDADRFADEVLHSTALVRDEPERARAMAEAALARWQGELLPADLYVEAFAGRRERLRRLCITAYDVVAAAARHTSDVDAAVVALEHAIELDPLDESRYVRAASVLLTAKRRGAAHAMLRRARVAVEQLGVPPSPRLLELEDELRR